MSKLGKAEELHELTLDLLIKKVKSGDVQPSEIEYIRKFLLDQGVTCVGSKSSKVNKLAKDLPVQSAAQEFSGRFQ